MSPFNPGVSAISSAPFPMGSLRPRRRWGWLAVSVALNLLLIGLILAWVLTMRSPANVSWQREMIPSLSPSDAAIVETAIGRIADTKFEGDMKSHEAWGKVHTSLGAQPLDSDALTADMAEMTKIRVEQGTAMNQAFLEEMKSLSPDGRSKLVALMTRMWNSWKPQPSRR